MGKRMYKIKKEILPFLIAYLIIDIIIVGSFVMASQGVPKDMNVFERIGIIFSNFMPNFTGLKFFSAIIQDFNGFMSASFWTLVITIILFIAWKIKFTKMSEYEGIEHGSSEWSKGGEEFAKLSDGSEVLNKKNGFILSKSHYLGTDLKKVKVNKNILVVGGSGTGKTACYIKPNILQCLGSYVITDPKGELYRETSGFLKANGYNVRAFNLVNPSYSDRYNPLAHIIDHVSVDIIAHAIVMGGSKDDGKAADPFWDNTAIMLLKACIYYVISVLPKEEQNLSSCLNIVRQGGADEAIFDKLFIDELRPQHPGRKEYESIRVGADKTKQSIAIALTSKLSAFDTPPMQRITTSNNIEFDELGNNKTALFVITSAADSTYDYISTIFFSQMLQKMYVQADKNGGKLNNQVYFLLDEFANIGQIQDFNKKLSTTRSLGISISIIVQSLDQLESLYKDNYENIIGNCDTHVFLGSQSLKTCEYFSKSLGEKTISYRSRAVSKDKDEWQKQGVSISTQIQGRELMTIDELKQLNPDEEIILIRGLKPIKARKAWYFKYHPQFKYAREFEIKNESQMPKTEEVGICTMDVYAHLQARESKITQKITDLKEETKKDDFISEPKKENTNEIKIDLEKELEKKFDELFGTSTNH
ncbi:MAG: type IV secretory system conjugative DNA transfer family protein [Clostridia bacterium]